MSMVTLIVLLAAGFAIAGLFLGLRALVRRRSSNARRLSSLGVVDAHRERYR